jgi:hypothetical protein
VSTNLSQLPIAATTKFQALAALEPHLNELLTEARSHKGGCANARWYGQGGLRKAMQKVVGHLRHTGPEELRTSQAYDVAYRTLYAALPDCSGCGCLTLKDVLA